MLSYEALASRRGIMQNRCLIAVMKYAVYILNEDGNTANHANRLSWAMSARTGPDNTAGAVVIHVLGNQDFLDQDLGLSDSDLQGIVETVINNYLITPP